MLLGILSMVLFNAIDTYFVGKLGKDELEALTFTFPPILILFTVVQGVGIGATAIIAKSIGKGDRRKAARETTDSLVLGLILAIVFSALGFLFLEPLFIAIGASPTVLPLVVDYMTTWMFAICFVVVPFVGNSALRAAGDSTVPALIMLFAVFINAVLDPLLIFGYGPFPELGIRGAALATAISRAMTLILSLWVLGRRERLLTTAIPSWAALKGCWQAILSIGVPAGLSRMIVPVSTVILTGLLARLDNPHAVAGYGVATRIETIAAALLFALSASMGPFTGQNLGLGYYNRIQKGLNKANIFSLFWGVGMATLLFLLGPTLVGLFSNNPGVTEVATQYLFIVPIAIGFQGAVQNVNITLNTLNRPLLATLLLAIQMFGVYLPLTYFASQVRGEEGVFAGIAIAYFIGGLVSMYVGKKVIERFQHRDTLAFDPESVDDWIKK